MFGDRIRFEWLDWIVEKIVQKHGVEPEEAEACFFDPHRKIRRVEDGKYRLYGRTDTGRYLFIVFVPREGMIRVITAREMDSKERRIYARK